MQRTVLPVGMPFVGGWVGVASEAPGTVVDDPVLNVAWVALAGAEEVTVTSMPNKLVHSTCA